MQTGNIPTRQAIVPCFIPAFNNPTYVRRTLKQLAMYQQLKLLILDNASTYGPMLDLCSEIENGQYGGASVIRLGCNAGPRVVWYHLKTMPQYFCISDPDLDFNPDLPGDFLHHLIDLTETYMVGKAGFALSLADQDRMSQERFRHCEGWMTIWEAEAKNWQAPIPKSAFTDPLYYAHIDTTFAVYNRNYFNVKRPFDSVRVAGRYTCRHLPWYIDNGLPAEEEAFYRRATEFSYYMGDRPAQQVRALFAHQDERAPPPAYPLTGAT